MKKIAIVRHDGRDYEIELVWERRLERWQVWTHLPCGHIQIDDMRSRRAAKYWRGHGLAVFNLSIYPTSAEIRR